MHKSSYLWIIGLIVFALILVKVDLSRVLLILSKIRIPYIALAFLFIVPVAVTKTYRWKYLLKMQKIDYGFKASFLAYLAGTYVGIITPGRIGELARVYYLKRDKRISFGKTLSSVLIDRLFDLLVLILFSCLGLVLLSISSQMSGTIIVLASVFAVALVVLLNKEYGSRMLNSVYKISFLGSVLEKVRGPFNDFYIGIEEMKHWKLIFPLLMSLFAYLMTFFQSYLIAMSLNIPISFFYVIFFISIANLISLIPISISGMGTREATLIGLFAILGLKPELAVSFSLMCLFVLNISLAVMGLPVWWRKSRAYAVKQQSKREPNGQDFMPNS